MGARDTKTNFPQSKLPDEYSVEFQPGRERTFNFKDFLLRFKNLFNEGNKRYTELEVIDSEVSNATGQIKVRNPPRYKPFTVKVPLTEGKPTIIRNPKDKNSVIVIDKVKHISKTRTWCKITTQSTVLQNPQPQDGNINTFYDQLFYITARAKIFGIEAHIGTSFVVEVPLDDGLGSMATVAVSNRHVLADPNIRTELQFHEWNSGRSGPDPVKVKTIRYEDFKEDYYAHSDPAIDLALIDLTDIARDIYCLSIKPEMISNFLEPDLGTKLPIDFVGYPADRYDVVHYKPLVLTGHIGSSPKDDYNGVREFIIGANVIGGSSGSPVFTYLEGQYKLIGVVCATDIKYDPIKQLVSTSTLGVEHNLGLGHVIKSSVLLELIDTATTAIRKKRAQAKRSR